MSLAGTVTLNVGRASLTLPSIEVVVRGAAGRQPLVARLGLAPLTVGTEAALADVVVEDERISRRHCTFQIGELGLRVRDLGSKNGVFVGDSRIYDAVVPLNAVVSLARTLSVSFRESGPAEQIALTPDVTFGGALGGSPPMRALFAALSRAAPSEETVLLLGESGTGKEVLARAIHDRSSRRAGPFLPFDCGAVSPQLIEASLFGHVRGAFTGATDDQLGALGSCADGTLFLDEIGELPLDLQPKLLRALESRVYQPVGSGKWQPFTARIIAATHRDLATAVRERRFRADLFYRIAVINVRVPPLRERREDVELLVERFLREMTPPRELSDLPPHALAMLESHEWPGNVRELKNTVARLIVLGSLTEAFEGSEPSGRAFVPLRALLGLGLREARDQVVGEFERWFVREKLASTSGSVSRAAAEMGVSRQLLHRLMAQYALKAERS